MTKVNAMGLGVILPNGATVIAFFEGPRGGIVLARRDHELHPYVTWAYVENDLSSTTWGHYYEGYKEAWEDFISRVDRDK